MTCRFYGTKPLSQPIAGIFLIGSVGNDFSEIWTKLHRISDKIDWKMFEKGGHFVSASMCSIGTVTESWRSAPGHGVPGSDTM